MQALENYDPANAAIVNAGAFPTPTLTDTQLIGYGFDRVRREIVYSAVICQPGSPPTNTSGHTLWDGQTSVAPAAAFTASPGTPNAQVSNWNYWLARKNIDTGTVTFYQAYDVNQLVPAGIGGGDGTWRRYVSDTNVLDEYPILSNPRNGDAFVHQQSCDVYQFRRADSYAMAISPLRPVGAATNALIPQGMNGTWVYITESVGVTENLYLVPPSFTADEIAADKKLIYATFALPSGYDNRSFWTAIDNDGDLWAFSAEYTGVGNFQLHKFVQPSAFAYPTPPVDGGFVSKTGWTTTTGPNIGATGASSGAEDSTGRPFAFFNAGRTELQLLACTFDSDYAVSDPTNPSVVHTWYRLADDTWGSTLIAKGYMTASFQMTNDPNAAAFAITGRIYAHDRDLDQDNYFADRYYLSRWLFFEVLDVTAGVVNASDVRLVLVQLTWNASGAPTVSAVIDEKSAWDAAYTAYGTAISNSRVVYASIWKAEDGAIANFLGFDVGIYDPDGSPKAWYWSGFGLGGAVPYNMFELDAAFSGRAAHTYANAPILKLSLANTAHAKRSFVWSTIGHPYI